MKQNPCGCALLIAVASFWGILSPSQVVADSAKIYFDLNAAKDNPFGGEIVLGTSDGLALDQPRGAVMFSESEEGPRFYNQPGVGFDFLFDTGANGIVVFGAAVYEMEQHGYAAEGTFTEQGVAGFTTYDVSYPYYFEFAGSDGMELGMPDVRAMSDQYPQPYPFGTVGSYWGIAGMPALVQRVTTMDMSVWSGGIGIDNLFMGVEFSESLPESNGHRYSVPITPMPFAPEGEGPLPAWAPIPFVTTKVASDSAEQSGGFLFDTGAQMSMLSGEYAFLLGLDSNGDGELDSDDERWIGEEAVGGIGGSITVPIFQIDSIALPTEEGVDLVWTDASVIVLDIHPDIKGIVGSDLLTSGWINAFYGGSDGYIDKVQLDFRALDLLGNDPNTDLEGDLNGDGFVGGDDLDLIRAHWGDTVTPGDLLSGDPSGDGFVGGDDLDLVRNHWGEGVLSLRGDLNGDGFVGGDDLDLIRSHWGENVTAGDLLAGDPSGDGFVGGDDLDLVRSHWGEGTPPAPGAVPEPGASALVMLGLAVGAWALQRGRGAGE